MDFINRLISLDHTAMIWLNNLGVNRWDGFWKFITHQTNWIPLFLVIYYLIFRKKGWKMCVFYILIAVLLITCSDQLVNLVKHTVQRLRPGNNEIVKNYIRVIVERSSYSFFSGHATTSTALTVFWISILKEHFKAIWLLLLWPLVFSYSRVYLGLHFPLDIIIGFAVGSVLGILFYYLSKILQKRFSFLDKS